MAVKGLQHWLVTVDPHPVGLVSLQPEEGGRRGAIGEVWLRTSSLDHPHALADHQRRGFQPCCTEPRCKEVPHSATGHRAVTVSAVGE